MPINDIAHGLPRTGKIRMGAEVEAKNGKTRPTKLDTWRLTSPAESVIRAAADLWGGECRPWDNDGNPEFEVITETSKLKVLITPEQDAFSQWYELWSGGGCQRRCDGDFETLSGEACKCPADRDERAELAKNGKACKATTRVSVVLPELPVIGCWMLESHGFYAAKELGSTFALLDMSGARRSLLPAELRIEQRVQKRDGKRQEFGVPVFDIALTLEGLVSGAALPAAAVGELDNPEGRELPPAEPVTSTKKAAAKKQAAPRQPAAPRPGAEPMDEATLDGFRARIVLLEQPQVDLFKKMLDGVGIAWGAKRMQHEVAGVEETLTAVEAKQASLWEDRRKAVAAALPAGLDEDARHELIATATARLGDEHRTESMKTLTQEQANAILDHLEELETAAAGEQQTLEGAAS